jgi:hypothetical protein
MFHVKFDMFVDRPAVMRAIEKKQLRVLSQTGAYGRQAMKRTIRPPKAGKRARTVEVAGRQVLVPVRGRVLDAKTLKPVTTELAKAARLAMAARLKSEGAGKPPRRGPSDLLRKFMFFGIDSDSETVVIGPMKFDSQPRLIGRVSVPELLDKGGGQIIGSDLVKYDPHPFTPQTLDVTEKKFRELIEKVPL